MSLPEDIVGGMRDKIAPFREMTYCIVMKREADEKFMRAALREARKGVGLTSPNPAVGAVLVVGGKICARGHHRSAGAPHAEIECLTKFTRPLPRNAALYITLEPCSTRGRTPPCTETLLKSGIRTVVIGTLDPNPKHSGRAIEILRAAGIVVQSGVLAAECRDLNEAFDKWITTKRPFVISKCGMSLDGRLTRPPKEARWLTSTPSRTHANRFRAQVDAILIGAETLRADNPRLTVRNFPGARQPWRVVVSHSGKTPRAAHLFTDRFADRTLIFTGQSLDQVLDDLGKREITSVLLEGGGDVLGQALDQRLIDRVHIYLGAIITGGSVPAFAGRGADGSRSGARLSRMRYEKIGHDIFLSAEATYGEPSHE